MSDEPTLPDTRSEKERPANVPPFALALVVALSADEPERTGEVAFPPPGDPGAEVVWGRAGGANDDRRLMLQRHRPGRVIARGEITSPRVSRAQLRVQALGDSAIAVANVGRAPLVHNGRESAVVEARAGDVIEVGKQIVFLCVRRPAWLPGPAVPGDPVFGAPDAHGIVGESSATWDLRRRLAFVGPLDGHVIVLGPSGSGKELVARALHAASARAERAIVARNAATLPEGIVDAELFGNVKNYPHAGMPERPGIVGEADRSTLFLDEIGEVSAAVQAHLLRLLDDGEYHRLGESRARRADVRLIGATNRPEASLKHDLRARLTLRVDVPGLEDRREDIPLVAHHLLRRIAAKEAGLRARFFAERGGLLYPRLSPGLVRVLLRRSYPTNVRELEGLLWEALAESPGDRLEVPAREIAHPFGLSAPRGASSGGLETATDDADRVSDVPEDRSSAPGLEESPNGPSPAAIQSCLDAHNGVIEDAWRPLGLSSRHALARLLKKHGIEIRRRPR